MQSSITLGKHVYFWENKWKAQNAILDTFNWNFFFLILQPESVCTASEVHLLFCPIISSPRSREFFFKRENIDTCAFAKERDISVLSAMVFTWVLNWNVCMFYWTAPLFPLLANWNRSGLSSSPILRGKAWMFWFCLPAQLGHCSRKKLSFEKFVFTIGQNPGSLFTRVWSGSAC